jgi:hypothetical protein
MLAEEVRKATQNQLATIPTIIGRYVMIQVHT